MSSSYLSHHIGDIKWNHPSSIQKDLLQLLSLGAAWSLSGILASHILPSYLTLTIYILASSRSRGWERGYMGLLGVVLSYLPGNYYPLTDQVIKSRRSQLQDEEELEKLKKKRRLDFLDILLFARVSVWNQMRDLRLDLEPEHKKQTLLSHLWSYPDGKWKKLIW